MTLRALWSDAFDAGKARIDDEFLHRLVRMFRARALLYQIVSWTLLVLTSVTVLVGITMFIRGDPGSDVLAESEVELHRQIDQKQGEIDALHRKLAQVDVDVVTADRADVLATILARAKSGLLGFRDTPTPVLRESVLRVLNVSKLIVEATRPETHAESTTIVVSVVQEGDPNAFSSATLALLKEGMVVNSIDLATLQSEIEQLVSQLESLQSLSLPAGESTYPSESLDPLNGVLTNAMNFLRLDELHIWSTEKVAVARRSALNRATTRTVVETQRQALERDKANLDRRLTSVREQREKILFMAWIPGLTLRVGAVVLLLFLTQILLATYRYAAGVSAFYLARGDAVQLMQSHPDNPRRYAVDQLQSLMDSLTPSRYEIDSVKDPTEQLTELAKVWATRK